MEKLFKRKKRSLLVTATAFVALLAAGYFFFFVFTPASYIRAEQVRLPAFPALKDTDRIVVVAPHLDDEGLGVGGLLAEARRRNIPVTVIFMTNGDGNYYGADIRYKTLKPNFQSYIDYGKVRQYEALRATALLGIPAADVHFLGLPDRGLDNLLAAPYYDRPYVSPYTGQSHSPYQDSAVPNLAYTGRDSKRALTDLINASRPTIIFAPLLQDHHPDHAATGRYVQEVLPQITSRPHAYLYLVHYPKYPVPRGINPTYPLLPPAKLSSLSWETIPLPTDIVELKRRSVDQYVTQLGIPEVSQLLRSLVRKNELVVDGF